MRAGRRLPFAPMLLLLSALWGIAFVAIKEALRELSPVTLTLLRFAIPSACLLVLVAAWPDARPRLARRRLGRAAGLAQQERAAPPSNQETLTPMARPTP
ncbi:MAG: EamA family transporter [Acidobacteria bacterium]|nr:EamA family transporter [Acidobacteriota bacterium]